MQLEEIGSAALARGRPALAEEPGQREERDHGDEEDARELRGEARAERRSRGRPEAERPASEGAYGENQRAEETESGREVGVHDARVREEIRLEGDQRGRENSGEVAGPRPHGPAGDDDEKEEQRQNRRARDGEQRLGDAGVS